MKELKLPFQRKLSRAWTTDLIERIESSTKAAVAKRPPIHLGGDTKWSAGSKAAAHRAEIGMIEDIEEIRSELKVNTIGEVELAPKRQVHLKQRESS